MKKINFLVATILTATAISSGAFAKDSGFSSTFPSNAQKRTDFPAMSPAAGTPSEKKHHAKTHHRKNETKKLNNKQPADQSKAIQ